MSDYYPLNFHIKKSRLEICNYQIWIEKQADYESLLTPGLLTTANSRASPPWFNQHFRDTILRAAGTSISRSSRRPRRPSHGGQTCAIMPQCCMCTPVRKKSHFSKMFAAVYLMKR
jgi:hypothetical protein